MSTKSIVEDLIYREFEFTNAKLIGKGRCKELLKEGIKRARREWQKSLRKH